MSGLPPICTVCSHWRGESESCAAYPDGVPSDILLGADHRSPRGDEVDGTTFDLVEGFSEFLLTWTNLASQMFARPEQNATVEYALALTPEESDERA